VYLVGPSIQELDYLLSVFLSLAPKGSVRKYKLAEFLDWKGTQDPEVTVSVKRALGEGVWLPYVEPARKRIREGRGFELRLWDGREIDDPSGSFSISLYSLHFRDRGVMSCARYLFPIDFDHQRIAQAARDIAANVRLKSGHGGLTFAYNPSYRAAAFEAIYHRARRFWCVDVEDLQGTLSTPSLGIKAVSWLTMIGADQPYANLANQLGEYASRSTLELSRHRHGAVAVIGSAPGAGDVNRPGEIPAEYFDTAQILSPAFVKDHREFPTVLFADPNTMGWIRRFIEPAGWR